MYLIRHSTPQESQPRCQRRETHGVRIDADELVAYDRHLIPAATEHGLVVSSPAGV